jgi:hypothetical protein
MTTKADAFWKALDDLSPEDRESIGNAARAMLGDAATVAADAAAKWDDEKGPGVTIQTGKRGMAIAKAVRGLVRP